MFRGGVQGRRCPFVGAGRSGRTSMFVGLTAETAKSERWHGWCWCLYAAVAASSVPLRRHRRRKDSARSIVAGSITDEAIVPARWTTAPAGDLARQRCVRRRSVARCHTAIYVIYASNKLARSIGISCSEHVPDRQRGPRDPPPAALLHSAHGVM